MTVEAKRQLDAGTPPEDVAQALIDDGFSSFTAHEMVAVLRGSPPDEVPAGALASVTPRPNGQEIFSAKTAAEQDEMLGPAAAHAVRRGEIKLEELVEEVPMDSDEQNWIIQKPLDAAL